LIDQSALQTGQYILSHGVIQYEFMDLPGQLLEKTLWRKVKILKVGVIDKIMTPITTVLAFNCFKLLLSGSTILICYLFVTLMQRYQKRISGPNSMSRTGKSIRHNQR